jgi:hypothetical protein
MTNTPKLLTETKLAIRLQVKAAWLREEAEAGRLPAVRAGDRFLFDPATVERLLLDRAQKSASDGQG